jgi:hypothetical protein
MENVADRLGDHLRFMCRDRMPSVGGVQVSTARGGSGEGVVARGGVCRASWSLSRRTPCLAGCVSCGDASTTPPPACAISPRPLKHHGGDARALVVPVDELANAQTPCVGNWPRRRPPFPTVQGLWGVSPTREGIYASACGVTTRDRTTYCGTWHADPNYNQAQSDPQDVAVVVLDKPVTGDFMCRATNVDYRMDTASARAFLGQYVTLP